MEQFTPSTRLLLITLRQAAAPVPILALLISTGVSTSTLQDSAATLIEASLIRRIKAGRRVAFEAVPLV